MTSKRWDVLGITEYAAKDGKKARFSRIGSAWERREGAGWTLVLDQAPTPILDNGVVQYRLQIREPRESGA